MYPMLGRQQDSVSRWDDSRTLPGSECLQVDVLSTNVRSAETGDTGISFFLASILDHDRKGLRKLRHRSGKEKGREPPSKQETRLL